MTELIVLREGEAVALRAILDELAKLDTYGLRKDMGMATAAGSISIRMVNRARWLHQRITRRQEST